MSNEIDIIKKTKKEIPLHKKVTTAEFANVIEICIDSFNRQIIEAESLKTRGLSQGYTLFFDKAQEEEYLNEKIVSIITESQDMIKELKRIKDIAITFS